MPAPKPGHLRKALGQLQQDTEKLLGDYPQAIGPIDILELVADAFQNSSNKACAEELRALVMELREINLGCPKVHLI